MVVRLVHFNGNFMDKSKEDIELIETKYPGFKKTIMKRSDDFYTYSDLSNTRTDLLVKSVFVWGVDVSIRYVSNIGPENKDFNPEYWAIRNIKIRRGYCKLLGEEEKVKLIDKYLEIRPTLRFRDEYYGKFIKLFPGEGKEPEISKWHVNLYNGRGIVVFKIGYEEQMYYNTDSPIDLCPLN